MNASMMRRVGAAVCALTGLSLAGTQPTGISPLNPPPNGMRRADVSWHALVGATVHVKPGVTLEEATVVIRDGRIEAVGKVEAPAGAKVWDCKGLHVYAGFIDPFVEVEAPAPDRSAPGVHWNTRVTPQRRALDGAGVDERTAESLRRLGYAAAGISPSGGIFRGRSAVVSLGRPATELSADRPPVYLEDAYQTVSMDTRGGRGGGGAPATPGAPAPARETPDVSRWSSYPGSLMGAIALIRQTLIDAQWQSEARRNGEPIALNGLDVLTGGGSWTRQAARESEGRSPALAAAGPVSRSWTGMTARESAAGPELWFDVSDELDALRAAKIAREFGRKAVIVGSGQEYQRLEAIKADGLSFVIPLSYPRAPDVSTIGRAESVDLRELMAWEQAPTNPRRMEEAGISTALTTSKLRNRTEFTENLGKALKHGLKKDAALAMVTTRPAELLGVGERLGTVEAGKVANLVVAEGNLFDAWPKREEARPADGEAGADEKGEGDAAQGEARGEGGTAGSGAGSGGAVGAAGGARGVKIRDVWIDGVRHEISPPPGVKLEGTWEVTLDPAPQEGAARMTVDARNALTVYLGERSSRARNVSVADARVSFVLDDGALGLKGVSVAAGVIEGEEIHGTGVAGDGRVFRWSAKRVSKNVERPGMRGRGEAGGREGGGPARRAESDQAAADAQAEAQPEARREAQGEGERGAGPRPLGRAARGGPEGGPGSTPRKTPEEIEKEAIAAIPEKLGYPFGPYAVEAMPEQETVIFTNATIWTAGPQGVLRDGWLLIEGGRIAGIGGNGQGTPKLSSARVVDLKGKHIAPGIIDCHSHTGISRGVNEGGQAVTAEVRIGDVTDPDAISWYRQLGAGVTAVNNLHGSANAIGGQNQVNKIRWGVTRPDQMHFEGAAPGIKFALGENPRQANSGGGGGGGGARYPQTRMGVETLIRDRFAAAREYVEHQRNGSSSESRPQNGQLPHRRDLELEALAEILEGKRLVHCHSYRQDEILMLCRVAEEFGFKIGTFQHVLEGYKVADEIAKHALGGSCFTDWWAYKVEVQDAIAAGGPIMAEQGVLVSFNSDSDELARRLNSEAAKAVKYGDRVTPEEALKYVTLNPAKQLKVEDRVGSLEVGKDADFAVWSGPPMSSMSRCEATYVDGRRLFSLEDDAKHREKIQAERTRIIQKALASGAGARGGGAGAGEGGGPPAGFGGRRRPTEEDARAGMLREFYIDMLNRGMDPDAARAGECGCGWLHWEE